MAIFTSISASISRTLRRKIRAKRSKESTISAFLSLLSPKYSSRRSLRLRTSPSTSFYATNSRIATSAPAGSRCAYSRPVARKSFVASRRWSFAAETFYGVFWQHEASRMRLTASSCLVLSCTFRSRCAVGLYTFWPSTLTLTIRPTSARR